jgi:phosphate transport system substrate-binding protein
MDGMAVIVHPSNNISAITREQIKAIYTGKISEWSGVGGSAGQIVVLSRDSASGTFEAFGELALDKAKVRADALMQASNQAIATTVEKTPGGIGYVGLGFVSPRVKAIPVNGVMATRETVLGAKYILSRPLFMYTNGAPQGAVKSYLDFITSPEGQGLVEEIGYVGLK